MIVDTQEVQEYRRKFYDYYHSKIAADLAEFESSRGLYLALYLFLIALMVIAVIVTACLVFYYKDIVPDFWRQDGPGEVIMRIGLLAAILLYAGAYAVNKRFENKVKGGVINSFLSFFGTFKWSCKDYIDKSVLLNSKLVGSITSINSDDYFEGSHKDVGIIISELELIRGSGKNRSKIFDGIFIKLGMNKHFNSHTIVIEDFSFSKLAGEAFLPYMFTGMNKTELEDPEFNKMFNVYTQDEVEARYILTTSFMERLKHLKETYKAKDIRASFLNNSLLIAMSCGKDMFVLGDVRKPVTDAGQMQTLFEEFAAVLAIIDILKLDVRTGL